MAITHPADHPAGASAPACAAVFLDKDGTVLENVPYNVDPAQMRFAPGAAEGLRMLAALGCPLVIVSNQPGIAEGRFAEDALTPVFERLHEMFRDCGAELSGFVYCPHGRPADGEPGCGCRKPDPGLLVAAAARFRVDLARSWMVGDILDDIEAGRRAGCRTVLVDNGNETEWRRAPLREPHHVVGDFAAAARLICGQWTTEAAA